MLPLERKIIHFDMDAFFASVEQRDNPSLQGKPVIVCSFNGGRGVVSTASYEARAYGVKSAMPGFVARRLCPGGYFIAPDFEKYRKASDEVYEILYQYTDLVEAAGLDEAFVDVTINKFGLPSATWIAQDIRYEVFKKTKLTISAGVGPNKLIAKIASDYQKPNGLTVVPPAKVKSFLQDLPVRKIPGIGPVTESKCWSFNIKKISDFLKFDVNTLELWFGKSGSYFRDCAAGIDDRPLTLFHTPKSCGIEDTLEEDILSQEAVLLHLESLAKKLEKRLTTEKVSGRTVTLKVKYFDFQLVTRRHTLPVYIGDWQSILDVIKQLLPYTEIGKRPVRLLGISLSQLQMGLADPAPFQPLLFE